MFCSPLSNSVLMDNKLFFLTLSVSCESLGNALPAWSFSMEFLPSPPEQQDHSRIRSSQPAQHEPLGWDFDPKEHQGYPKNPPTCTSHWEFHKGETPAGSPGWVGAAAAFCSQFFLVLPLNFRLSLSLWDVPRNTFFIPAPGNL